MWLLASCLGSAFQFWHLWHFKKKGKILKQRHLQEAIDKFEYGRTAEERKRDKEVKQFEKYVEQNIEKETDEHASLYIDLESKCRSNSQNSEM